MGITMIYIHYLQIGSKHTAHHQYAIWPQAINAVNLLVLAQEESHKRNEKNEYFWVSTRGELVMTLSKNAV